MNDQFSRRDVLRGVISAGAMTLIKPARAADSEMPIAIASAAMEISIFSISLRTVRITIRPIKDGHPMPLPFDGALVREEWNQQVARIRSLSSPRTVRSGDLKIHFSPQPLTIRIERKNGEVVQELSVDQETAELSFELQTDSCSGWARVDLNSIDVGIRMP